MITCKRIFSLLLITIIVVSGLSINASAIETEEANITVLSEKGIDVIIRTVDSKTTSIDIKAKNLSQLSAIELEFFLPYESRINYDFTYNTPHEELKNKLTIEKTEDKNLYFNCIFPVDFQPSSTDDIILSMLCSQLFYFSGDKMTVTGAAEYKDGTILEYENIFTSYMVNNWLPGLNYCGPEAIWNFDEETGKLIIEGTGTITAPSWCNTENFDISKITSLHICEGITVINEKVFSEHLFVSATLPESLESLKANTFKDCVLLKEIIIPDSVKSIGESAFANCYSLTLVTLPENLEKLEINTFANCDLLNEITIPEAVKSIDSGVFDGCGSLIKITVINPEAEINLRSVTFPERATIYGLPGSTAEEYAEQFSRKFVPINNCTLTFVPEVPASCGKDGVTAHYKCSDCDYIYLDSEGTTIVTEKELTIPALTHKYIQLETLPTCTTKGYTMNICVYCSDVYTSDEKNAVGHTLGEYTAYIEPTCTSTGIKRAECKNCDYYAIDIIPAAAHNFTETVYVPTCISEGFTLYLCESCNMTYLNNFIEMTPHLDMSADGFCDYCQLELEESEEPEEIPQCNHICHKDGFFGVLWKIISFFSKLFGKNPVCECGAAHW